MLSDPPNRNLKSSGLGKGFRPSAISFRLFNSRFTTLATNSLGSTTCRRSPTQWRIASAVASGTFSKAITAAVSRSTPSSINCCVFVPTSTLSVVRGWETLSILPGPLLLPLPLPSFPPFPPFPPLPPLPSLPPFDCLCGAGVLGASTSTSIPSSSSTSTSVSGKASSVSISISISSGSSTLATFRLVCTDSVSISISISSSTVGAMSRARLPLPLVLLRSFFTTDRITADGFSTLALFAHTRAIMFRALFAGNVNNARLAFASICPFQVPLLLSRRMYFSTLGSESAATLSPFSLSPPSSAASSPASFSQSSGNSSVAMAPARGKFGVGLA
mmetsp:Transcript_10022/g.19319  ORF Transcript_10022/g.19319 Transcript_10022/m.19319 type:complete len:332 (-) Transcript_10022:2-997(-)